jgi:hypothetical protein
VDPLYRFSPEEIRRQIDQTYPVIVQKLHENIDDFVWDRIPSPEALGRHRMESMERFLEDLPVGLDEGRYLPCELPDLPFGNQAFDLALCSHFLFLYSDRLSAEFHRESIQEMLRVAGEVRIFPVKTLLEREPSPYLEGVCAAFRDSGRRCEIRSVEYEFQRGVNQMLRIS